MKGFLIAILSFIVIAVSAQSDSLVKENNVLSGRWNLVEFKNLTTGEITDSTSVQNEWKPAFSTVRLQFHDSLGRGEILGKSFCNDVNGRYLITGGNKITVTSFGGTKVGCQLEGKLWDAIHASSSYKRSKDTLVILYNHNSEEMLFVPEK